ncbi:MAG TPA: 1-deoxy-D-xylulose-5-phosphate synthase [Thermodesulfobacteriota bacterium]|nr:1-deoxy-D-xylulose-5-phosphate synthase [Thermodesulfobacteriota bacterium]
MGDLLKQIQNPSDLRRLPSADLTPLAEEIREEIVQAVSKVGGHLASSLGVVELTLALHYVFDTPRDRIVWDVGHQTYAHKLITGRRENFRTLRQSGGICGFPRREESPYDAFGTGHSGTSISAALGMAQARCLRGEDFKVIAVIGDGSMTAGEAFEGLNQAGAMEKDLIVILNDNELSISPNVGALSSYLNRLMTGQFATHFREEIKSFLRKIPGIGSSALKWARYAEESLKGFFLPGLLFEELGFKYVGPLPGHKIDSLIENFRNIKQLPGPILVHVLTTKGKGYPPAEKDPVMFHGVGPFIAETGEIRKAKGGCLSYTEAFGQTMVKLARQIPCLVGITAAMPQGTGLEGFAAEFPDRFFDVGIAEQHGITFAAGLAVEGFIPVVAIYSTFMQRAYDQVLHDVCLQNLPVVLALDRGGIVGADGSTHQGLFDFSYLRHIPNLVVMAPKDENELQHMLKTAISCGQPASLRYPRGNGWRGFLDEEAKELPVGKGEVLRQGKDLILLAIGSTVKAALQAASRLQSRGVEASVVNARFLKPLDSELICSLAVDCPRLISVEENALQGGFGSAVLELLEEKGMTGVEVKRLGIPDVFVEHGAQEFLRHKYGIDAEAIVQAAEALLKVRNVECGMRS